MKVLSKNGHPLLTKKFDDDTKKIVITNKKTIVYFM